MGHTYEWKRFWCPRDGKIDLSDNGFLTDPEGDYYEYSGADVVPFEKISDQAGLEGSYGGLHIGAGSNLAKGSFFSGLIDDVRIYNRAVTP